MKKGIKSNKIQNHGFLNNKNNKNYNDIYNINNFYSSTVKIKEKSISHIVQCPKYEELDDDFFFFIYIEVRIIVNKIINLLIFQDNEDISNEAYLKFHKIFEQKEIDYRRQIFSNYDKKKSKKEIKREIAETQKAYKNLYTIFDIDDGQINNKNDNLNIIKIKLF